VGIGKGAWLVIVLTLLGVIAIGVSLLFGLVDVGEQPEAPPVAAATATCTPPARLFGAQPPGFRYAKPSVSKRFAVLRPLKLGAQEDASDVSLAFRGDERVATLVAIPGLPDAFVRAVERNARETDAPMRHSTFGRSRALVVDNQDTGEHVVIGLRGCVGLIVRGAEPDAVETLAAAVFTD
jgi:hypothetical protein